MLYRLKLTTIVQYRYLGRGKCLISSYLIVYFIIYYLILFYITLLQNTVYFIMAYFVSLYLKKNLSIFIKGLFGQPLSSMSCRKIAFKNLFQCQRSYRNICSSISITSNYWLNSSINWVVQLLLAASLAKRHNRVEGNQ